MRTFDDPAAQLARGESLFYDETPVRRSAPNDLDGSATAEMLEAIQDQGLDLSGADSCALDGDSWNT